MDRITYNFIDVEIPDLNPEFFDLWLGEILKLYKRDVGEISFVFCTDEYLHKLNHEHLDHDYYTDIITFNYNDRNSLSGDIFISYERVRDNAKVYGNENVFDELCRVMAHGILHLAGFDDKTDLGKAQMRTEEDRCLALR